MTKVNVTEKLPALTPEMFPDAEVVGFRITEVRHIPFKGDRGLQDRIVLISDDHDGYGVWTNMTSLRALVAKYGDDDDNWIDKVVPLVPVRTNNPTTGKTVSVFWVADANDDAWDAVNPKPRAAAKSAAKKRGRK